MSGNDLTLALVGSHLGRRSRRPVLRAVVDFGQRLSLRAGRRFLRKAVPNGCPCDGQARTVLPDPTRAALGSPQVRFIFLWLPH
jgi:hypothetical protein